ncbi:hypothetical protein NPIL_279761 [Nephila pilipes]|uniref:Uncharacterized protein n=1 Tax=Nephila pilipes TaxID=299642 RepID=A0A8X6PT91_NEPPI|nr:hypothetical protein NPIL_279761 [Nephila pilipes]
MVYIPPEDAPAKRTPEIISLPFPETIPEKIPAPLEKLPMLPAPVETVPEPSPTELIILKPVEAIPFFPCHRKRSLETPPCSIPNKVRKSEPTEEDVHLLLKTETIETTQMKPEVGNFVMLYRNHPPKIWWVQSDQTQLIRVVTFVRKQCIKDVSVTSLSMFQ